VPLALGMRWTPVDNRGLRASDFAPLPLDLKVATPAVRLLPPTTPIAWRPMRYSPDKSSDPQAALVAMRPSKMQ